MRLRLVGCEITARGALCYPPVIIVNAESRKADINKKPHTMNDTVWGSILKIICAYISELANSHS